MILDTNFKGRVFQVMEALDFGDAVSNQAVELDGMLRRLGLETGLYSKWHHEKMRDACIDLSDLKPTDEDVVILHFSGHSQYALPYLQELRCTKICLYHNITPHTFFKKGTALHEHCLKGREQLQEIIRDFHYFWGDSKFNLQELIDAGVNPKACAVVPIVVNPSSIAAKTTQTREAGAWMFLGRIASNKGHVKLVELFANVRMQRPALASKLYLVGGWQATDPYYKELIEKISRLKLTDHVVLAGKVSESEVEDYFCRASLYVSVSEHEGFGVPLIEAAHRNLAVVALGNTAIEETLGDGSTCYRTLNDLQRVIIEISSNDKLYQKVLNTQRFNAKRFSLSNVETSLTKALELAIPCQLPFKTVSIVICTYNRSDLLTRCLDYLQYQTNQNFEVVIVDGPSTDSTPEVIEKYKNRVKIGKNPERNLSKSRNIGIELSDGDIIAFIDDDALPFDDWINTLLLEFNRRPLSMAALGGPVYYAGTLEYQAQDIGINKLAEAQANIDSAMIGKDGWERSLLGTNTCFRADYVREIRGFDEQFDYFLDESELCFRLQLRHYIVGYCPNLFLRHEFAQSHNREGKYKYNWFTICKNTAYFISAYSGLKGDALFRYIEQRMLNERIKPLEVGQMAGEISNLELLGYRDAINKGMKQGIADAKQFPRTRILRKPPGNFRSYTQAASYPLIGRDLKRLHICIVTKEFSLFSGNGGIGTLYYHLASELLLMGHYVTVIVPGDKPVYCRGRFSVLYAKHSLICTDVQSSTGFVNNTNWSLSAFKAVAELHVSSPVDIIDSALWDSETLAISVIDRSLRPPLVLRLVTPFPVAARLNGWTVSDREDGLFKTAERSLIANADAVVPISESIAKTIETEYDISRDSRWVSSHCGIAYWPFFDSRLEYSQLTTVNERSLAIPKDAKIVLFVGRLESRKGIATLLTAANQFLAAEPLVHLLLAGRDIEGWTSQSKTMIKKEFSHRVHFLGEVNDATREKLLNAAYCLVFPSRYESFGLVPLEAFVHGTPVIASKAGAIPEVVSDEVSGLLFEPDDAASLAKSVQRLLLDTRLRQRLSEGAKAQVRRFSSRNSAIRAVKLYSSLLLK
jgi:glycosyltransferase involved in cell wall biosynthesis